ncbi:MAG: two-component system sensor histidine kinase NtrB [Gemmatimonas sp.]|uniref:two-component system sensor histidine kinase NtrB n=1 Tax=Gemmatimonas sp. TaxID=1962908 RepID=UPI00391F2CD0
MTPTPSSATLPDFVRLLAAADDAAHGIATVLEQLAPALGVARLTLETENGDAASGAAPGTGERADARPVRVPVMAGETRVGTLVVHGTTALLPHAAALVGDVAALLAVAISRDAYLHDLEQELTARVREVADQRAFIECIVDSLPLGLYVVDRQYRIQAWNHKRETGLQGVARADAVGRSIFEVLNRQPAALLKKEFDEVFASGRLQQFQMESNAFGTTRTFRISKIPMRMGGRDVTHVITIGEDLTDWRAALDRTAQAEKLAALGQLAAGVMHEINNPLATIAACAESMAMQAETGTGAPPAELLHIIDLEVQRCKKIVNGLLDFSRPKAQGRDAFDLNTVVQQGLFLLQHHPRFKRVKVDTELEANGLLMVEGDADQLVQVLIALAMNAFDASPEQGRVVIRTRFAPADGLLPAVFEVEDNGPGIPRTLQAKVFEPFFTTKAPGQGPGLGLAICYGIVADHGGTLELVSPGGPGANFRVSLPVLGAAGNAARDALGTLAALNAAEQP